MDKFTKEQALAIMGYCGVTTMPFSDFHEDVEKRVGRAVWTHEFGEHAFVEKIQKLYKEEFLAMCGAKDVKTD